MGKIFNALEKYKLERSTVSIADKVLPMDWEMLLTYDRSERKLDLNRADVKDRSGTVKRLLTYGFIQADGTLTPAGIAKCDELENQPPLRDTPVAADGSRPVDVAADSSVIEADVAAVEPDPEIPADITLPPELEIPDTESEVAVKIALAPPEEIVPHVAIPEKKLGEKKRSPAAPIEPLKIEDWKVLMQYDRASGILDLKSPGLAEDALTVQRLLDHKLIVYGGKLTPAALRKCKELENKKHKLFPSGSKKKADVKNRKNDIQFQDEHKQPVRVRVKPVVEKESVVRALPKTTDSKNIDQNLVSFLRPKSFEAEQFKILRTNLMYPVNGQAPKSIMVTSALPDEGKSFVAANLAISIAEEINRNVLLLDCDLRRPSIHSRFGYPEVPGLSDYLSNGTPLQKLLLRTPVDALTILPAGKPPHNPSELLSSERMIDLIAEVTARYSDRLIILDTPPPKMTAEAGALARQVDGVLLVVKYGKTPRNTVTELIDKMGREKILGAIINNFDVRSSAYYSKYYGK